jgi:hypothetical protein
MKKLTRYRSSSLLLGAFIKCLNVEHLKLINYIYIVAPIFVVIALKYTEDENLKLMSFMDAADMSRGHVGSQFY